MDVDGQTKYSGGISIEALPTTFGANIQAEVAAD